MTDLAPPSRARAALSWFAVVLLPVLGVFLRYRAHPAHAFDPETSLAMTAGREWAHGRLGFLPHYQFNLHQGSQVLDGFLAMIGFAIFGDHTMAWASVGLFWVAVTALAGAVVLQRLVGWSGAWVWAGLLASSPFLIKDGMMALSGGHPPVGGFILSALALSVLAKEGAGRRALLLACLAGAVVGLGTWYTRSVVVAGPCVLVTLWPAPGRGSVMDELRRGARDKLLLASVVGLLLFPLLLATSAWTHQASDTRASQDDNFASRLINPITDMESCTDYEILQGLCEEGEGPVERFVAKTGEILGFMHARMMWVQPRSLVTGQLTEAWKPLREVASMLWLFGFIGGIPLLAWGIAAGRIERSAGLVLFAAGVYLALYLLTGMRIEEVPERFWDEVTEAPAPTNVRYLIPSWTLLLAALAGGIGAGLAGTGVLRWASGLLLAGLLLSGFGLSGRDVVADADPAIAFERHQSFRYFRNYVQGRGPPQRAHQVCDVQDPISRGNHLRSWASYNWCDIACLMQDLTTTDDELQWLVDQAGEVCGEPISEDDRAFVAHGLGVLLGGQANFFDSKGIGITVLRAYGAGESLDEVDARWFFQGVQDALWDYGDPMDREEAIGLLCRETKWGTRPLCALVGIRSCEWELPTPPADPLQLCPHGDLDLAQLADPVRIEVIRGIGRSVGFSFPPLDEQAQDWSGWSTAEREAFVDGWLLGGRWRWRNDPMPYRPDRVP